MLILIRYYITVLILGIFVMSVSAGTLPLSRDLYSFVYDPVNGELPSDANPAWVLENGLSPITDCSGDFALLCTNSTGSWVLRTLKEMFSPQIGFTIDMRLKLISGDVPLDITIVTNERPTIELRWKLSYNKILVEVKEEGYSGVQILTGEFVGDDDDLYHNYRLVRDGEKLGLYVDKDSDPLVFVSKSSSTPWPFDWLTFGSAGGDVAGLSSLDYIAVYTVGAIWQAPVAPADCDEALEMRFEFIGDLTGDCEVDIDDLITLCGDWLSCYDSLGANCP